MKMIGHQAITQKIAIRRHKLPHFAQKEQVVLWLEKDGLPVVALIVDVVNDVLLEMHGGLEVSG